VNEKETLMAKLPPETDEKNRIPDPETRERLLANLRRTHLEMQEFNLQIEEITNKLKQEICQKRLTCVHNYLSLLTGQSPDVISTNAEIPS
jgi:hypothetical protein